MKLIFKKQVYLPFLLFLSFIVGNIIPYQISSIFWPKVIICNNTDSYITGVKLYGSYVNSPYHSKNCSTKTAIKELREFNPIEFTAVDASGTVTSHSRFPNWDMGAPPRLWFKTYTLNINDIKPIEKQSHIHYNQSIIYTVE